MAFKVVGLDISWKGKGVDEKGYVLSCSNPDYQVAIGTEAVAVDPQVICLKNAPYSQIA
jgi:GDPmannose 4,6-dehydratase